MRYLGGKQRLGKTIAEYINVLGALAGAETYCEPFCGMCGVGRRIQNLDRTFCDVHPDLIEFLTAIRDGWEPPTTLTEDEYKSLRDSPPSVLRGFAGFGCSFGGKWFGGYADFKNPKTKLGNIPNAAIKLGKDLNPSTITLTSYLDATPTDLTYCDPPYAGTTGYAGTDPFDCGQFWGWVRNRKGLVFVSEYTGPDWAEVIWQKPVKSTIKKDAVSGSPENDRIEKLFFVENS